MKNYYELPPGSAGVTCLENAQPINRNIIDILDGLYGVPYSGANAIGQGTCGLLELIGN